MKLLEDLQRARALHTSFLQGLKNNCNAHIPTYNLTVEEYSDPLADLISDTDEKHDQHDSVCHKADQTKKAYEKSTQAILGALGHMINTNCTHAARTLHTHPLLHNTHPYLYRVLQEVLGQIHTTKTSLLSQELINNKQFCIYLRQKTQSTGSNVQKDPTLTAIKELSKHLHYYTWLQAVRQSHYSLSQNCSRYQETTKGLPENLQLIISSMLNESMC
jgi:hypothetical protein